MTNSGYVRKDCRLCKSADLVRFLDLGDMPLAGAYLEQNQFHKEKTYPLEVYFCQNCKLVQLPRVVPSISYQYYMSSVSRTLTEHFANFAKVFVSRFLNPNFTYVAEIGCNDGVLLQPLKQLGVRSIGIEPEKNLANIAESYGLEVVVDYFTERIASEILKRKGKASAFIANNVFAHIDDLDEVMRGIKLLLGREGVFIFEVHYLGDLIEGTQYDNIYHEHMCYYSIIPLVHFLKRFDMEVIDVEKLPIHGGSIRVYAGNIGRNTLPTSKSAGELLNLERKTGLDSLSTFREFTERIISHRERLVGLLTRIKGEGNRIIGYGAAGRANTLLNYCGIGTQILEYIVDDSPARQGRYTPGMHIPIVSPQRMKNDEFEYVLVLAWTYKDEIMRKTRSYMGEHAKFIIPMPEIKVVD